MHIHITCTTISQVHFLFIAMENFQLSTRYKRISRDYLNLWKKIIRFFFFFYLFTISEYHSIEFFVFFLNLFFSFTSFYVSSITFNNENFFLIEKKVSMDFYFYFEILYFSWTWFKKKKKKLYFLNNNDAFNQPHWKFIR